MVRRRLVSVLVVTALIGVGVIIISLTSNVSLASFVSEDKAENNFTDGTVKLSIKETGDEGQYENQEIWYGNEVTKNVQVENQSNIPVLIRVQITPRWVEIDANGNEKPWLGDTTYIKINFTNISSDAGSEGTNEWIKDNTSDNLGAGGYYYYNTKVTEGSLTKSLIDKVSADIPENLKARYDGKKLKIEVKAEEVMASKEAYKMSWSNIQDQNIDNLLKKLCEK